MKLSTPGLQFPLDPNLYYPPLEPPEPGVKWGPCLSFAARHNWRHWQLLGLSMLHLGDGRAPDGNWYMDIEDEKVQPGPWHTLNSIPHAFCSATVATITYESTKLWI